MSRAAFTILVVLSVSAISAGPAGARWCSEPYAIEQAFPTSGPEETRWRLCWRWEDGPGLIVAHAYFRTAPERPWIEVLWEARVSQLFVPYHSGSPRYLDVSYGFGAIPLTAKDCPTSVGGAVIGASSEVCKQVRDRGLAWKDDDRVRRGEELVLWGVLDAGNYNYVIEWTFRDDGLILGRVGATAVNLPSAPKETHTHDPIWRVDVDLAGACCDTAMQLVHKEVGATGVDTMPVVASEAGIVWDPVAYTMLHVNDATLRNEREHATQYMLMPLREGTPRHAEPFSQEDLWVTRYRWNEVLGDELPSYVRPAEPIQRADVVLWYSGGLHHVFRDEDGYEDDSGTWRGTALTMWTGFTLKPANLFSRTPLYP